MAFFYTVTWVISSNFFTLKKRRKFMFRCLLPALKLPVSEAIKPPWPTASADLTGSPGWSVLWWPDSCESKGRYLCLPTIRLANISIHQQAELPGSRRLLSGSRSHMAAHCCSAADWSRCKHLLLLPGRTVRAAHYPQSTMSIQRHSRGSSLFNWVGFWQWPLLL